MPDYHCAECGAEASVQGGKVVRACGHDGAAVLAPRTCKLYGEGGIDPRGPGPLGRALMALKGLIHIKGA